MQYRRCLFMLTLLVATFFQGAAAQLPIDTLSMRAQTYFLSHDLLGGRATGTLGADLAAEYIASECRSIGLVPAGSTFTQPVPLEETTIEAGTQLTVTRMGSDAQFRYPADFTPNVGTRTTLTSFSGEGVYIGLASEITDEQVGGVDLRGAVAVAAGPRITTDAADMLRSRGAVGIVLLLPDDPTYGLYVRSRGTTRMYHDDPTIESSFLPRLPSILAGPRLSAVLVSGALQSNEIRTGPLGLKVGFNIVQTRQPVFAANVVCLLPGQEESARDTAIAFSAHYDHLGVVSPADTAGDDLYNGFADNAVGVAMLLGIARAMASDRVQPVRHSMLFLFFVGEERGLLGSDYYVARPFWPLDRTLAVINIDAGAPPARPVNWSLSGVDSTGLGAVALGVAHARGWQVSTSPATANSDYYPFVREGVPGIFVKPGPGAYEALSADSSDALRYRWRYYHDPQDEWNADFPFTGLQRYAEYAYLIARELDFGHSW